MGSYSTMKPSSTTRIERAQLHTARALAGEHKHTTRSSCKHSFRLLGARDVANFVKGGVVCLSVSVRARAATDDRCRTSGRNTLFRVCPCADRRQSVILETIPRGRGICGIQRLRLWAVRKRYACQEVTQFSRGGKDLWWGTNRDRGKSYLSPFLC